VSRARARELASGGCVLRVAPVNLDPQREGCDRGTVGDYKLVPPPVRFSRTPAEVRRSAPLPGEHNREVLREVGLSDEEIGDLERGGILGQGPAGVSG
jgi:crotonobetainyl-CoA:carnitine CoA-transferase CaiB-like acyl-CoA transferase